MALLAVTLKNALAPSHTVVLDGWLLTEGVGFTVNVPWLEVAGLPVPDAIQRYLYPLIPVVVVDSVSVVEVTPLYGLEFGTLL